MLTKEQREAIYRLALQQQHADLSDYLDSITVPDESQMAELAARLKRLSSDYAFMNAYPGAAAAMVNAADLIAGMAQRVPLSDEGIWALWQFPADLSWKESVIRLAHAVEQAHGIRSEK